MDRMIHRLNIPPDEAWVSAWVDVACGKLYRYCARLVHHKQMKNIPRRDGMRWDGIGRDGVMHGMTKNERTGRHRPNTEHWTSSAGG